MELDIQAFREKYPQFDNIDDTTLETLWDTQRLVSTKLMKIVRPIRQEHWRFVVLAHLCQIQENGIVGRLSSAMTGSVQTQIQYDGSYQWWNQTIYGAQVATVFRLIGTATLI